MGVRALNAFLQRHRAVLLAFGLFASYAYFYPAGGWNQNSRFALVRAVLERRTFQIDAYHSNTGDRALWQGHWYSDKAPGASLLALVPVEAARGVAKVLGVDPASLPGLAWTSYVAGVATSGLFTAAAAMVVFFLSLRWGFSFGAALFAATAFGLATPAWAYATLFMGHGLTAGCLMISFGAAIALEDAGEEKQKWLAWIVGLASGWAVITEFPAVIPGTLIVGLALLTVRDASRAAAPRLAARVVAGGALALAVLFAYHTVAFGSPFHLGYSSEEGFAEMRRGLFGITYPRLSALRGLLIGTRRGILPIAPLVALTPIGLLVLSRAWARDRPHARRRAAIVAAAIALFYLLLNASYFYWGGGWAFGPRHLTPALPFLALGLAPLWDWAGRIGRTVLVLGWIWGTAITLVAVSTTPMPPLQFPSPVTQLLMPAFLEGDLSLNSMTFLDTKADANRLRGGAVPHASWNLGEIMGLRGLTSLIPLVLIWIATAVALRLSARSRAPVDQCEPGAQPGATMHRNA
jgi:hypothetical protein